MRLQVYETGILKLGTSVPNLRVFTLRALKELLKIHKFEILQVIGSVVSFFPLELQSGSYFSYF